MGIFRRDPWEPTVVFVRDEPALLVSIVAGCDPDDYDEAEVKALIYKCQSVEVGQYVMFRR